MSKNNRRDFLKQALLGSAAVLTGMAGLRRTLAARSSGEGVDRRPLGRTGAEVGILGLGLGTAYTKSFASDPGAGEALLRRALELGINYWETGRSYGPSEEMISPVVKESRREIFLASKSNIRTYDGFRRDIETSLQRLDTEYLDLYLLAEFDFGKEGDLNVAESGAVEAARKARDEGLIRHFGVAGHGGAEILMDAIRRFEPDTVSAVFSRDRPDDGKYEDDLLPLAREKKMGIIAMETPRRGREGNTRGSDLIQYPLSLPGIACMVVGLDSLARLEESAAVATNFEPIPGIRKERTDDEDR